MKAKFKFKGKEVIIEDIKKVSALGKLTGLMFRKNSSVLLFEFGKVGKYSIHSYFCKPFLAIWLKENKVIEHKLIAPNSVIKPENEFDKLIEVPFVEKYKQVFDFFIERGNI